MQKREACWGHEQFSTIKEPIRISHSHRGGGDGGGGVTEKGFWIKVWNKATHWGEASKAQPRLLRARIPHLSFHRSLMQHIAETGLVCRSSNIGGRKSNEK